MRLFSHLHAHHGSLRTVVSISFDGTAAHAVVKLTPVLGTLAASAIGALLDTFRPRVQNTIIIDFEEWYDDDDD